jgi:hypothetical protein
MSNELVMMYKEAVVLNFKVPSQCLLEKSDNLGSLEGTDLWTWYYTSMKHKVRLRLDVQLILIWKCNV